MSATLPTRSVTTATSSCATTASRPTSASRWRRITSSKTSKWPTSTTTTKEIRLRLKTFLAQFTRWPKNIQNEALHTLRIGAIYYHLVWLCTNHSRGQQSQQSLFSWRCECLVIILISIVLLLSTTKCFPPMNMLFKPVKLAIFIHSFLLNFLDFIYFTNLNGFKLANQFHFFVIIILKNL